MACSSLVTISLPASITVIKPYAFNRTGIYAVTIPNGLTKVEKDSFSQCPNLTSVSIPSGITSIEDAAFGGCNSLTSITVPSSVTSLGLISFGYCPALTRVEFLGNPPTYLSNLFEGSPVVTIYFLSSVSGWGDTYAGRPTDILDGFRLSIENDTSKGELLQPVNYSSSNRSYLAGANLVISVAAKPGYLFAGWQGSLTSSSDTINIIMDSNKNVTASYAPDNQDNDSDGLTNFQESITYGTNPNQKDTNSDGIEDGQAVTLGYNPTFNFSALLGYLQSHPPTGLYTTLQYTGNYAAGQTAGRAEVTSFPATYNLYTTDQIQNMAIGDLVLTRDSDGKFTLEYNIEQSEDLQNWSVYSSNTQVVRLPPNKAFVRIKAKQ